MVVVDYRQGRLRCARPRTWRRVGPVGQCGVAVCILACATNICRYLGYGNPPRRVLIVLIVLLVLLSPAFLSAARVRPCRAVALAKAEAPPPAVVCWGLGVPHAVVCGERGRFNAWLSGAAEPRLAPHPGALAARPAGKRPCAFPRAPFAASVKKIYLMGASFK